MLDFIGGSADWRQAWPQDLARIGRAMLLVHLTTKNPYVPSSHCSCLEIGCVNTFVARASIQKSLSPRLSRPKQEGPNLSRSLGQGPEIGLAHGNGYVVVLQGGYRGGAPKKTCQWRMFFFEIPTRPALTPGPCDVCFFKCRVGCEVYKWKYCTPAIFH